jgi:glucose-1-phosphate thymidylyltransferase
MKAIIPMAGSGTRLRPLTYSRPKALLRVGSKPILAHIIDSLVRIGCDELVLVINNEGAKIPLFVRDYYPELHIHTVIQEETLGLGHAVSLTENIARSGELIVMYGDTIIEGDMDGFIDRTVDAVISVKEVADPRRFGVVTITGGLITRFAEKPSVPESNFAIIGLNYIKDPDMLFDSLNEVIRRNLKTKGEFQITDAFQLMAERGCTMKPFTIDRWFDAGTQKTLLETNAYMLQKEGKTFTREGSVIIPPVFIPDDAKIVHSIIGPNVTIGDEAVIEQSILSECIIGNGAKIVNTCLTESLIGEYAEVIDLPRKLSISDCSSLNFYSDKM